MVTDKDREAAEWWTHAPFCKRHFFSGEEICTCGAEKHFAKFRESAIAEDRAGRQFAHDIILDNLVSWGVLTDELQGDPRAALWKLIELERDAARDPRIDEKAAEMVAKAIAEHDAQLVKWLRKLEERPCGKVPKHYVAAIRRAIEAKEPWK